VSRRRHSTASASVRQLTAQAESFPLAEPCSTCGKRRYRTRKAAKLALRKLNTSDSMSVYRCGEFWHFGHTPWQVRRGVTARHDWQAPE
jgi:hypothetical protein